MRNLPFYLYTYLQKKSNKDLSSLIKLSMNSLIFTIARNISESADIPRLDIFLARTATILICNRTFSRHPLYNLYLYISCAMYTYNAPPISERRSLRLAIGGTSTSFVVVTSLLLLDDKCLRTEFILALSEFRTLSNRWYIVDPRSFICRNAQYLTSFALELGLWYSVRVMTDGSEPRSRFSH